MHIREIATGLQFPEGPVAMDDGSVIVVEIKAKKITRDPSRPGGLKHKHLVATYPDGGVRFQGNLDLPNGRVILDRTTLTPLKDGSVHQLIEDSKDGGQTWIASFDAIYARK